MRRRDYIAAVGTTAGIAIAGCSGSGSTGTMETRVSDQPGNISDFETLVLRITEIQPKPADEELMTVDIEDRDVDLVELQGDSSTSIGTTELETGDYEYLQLTVGEVVDATLSEGGEATVTTPGEAPLKFEQSFEIRADQKTTFLADFTPVKQGQAGQYILQPVADEVEVTYEGETSTGNESG